MTDRRETATVMPRRHVTTLLQRFFEQARTSADRIAFFDGECRLSYESLAMQTVWIGDTLAKQVPEQRSIIAIFCEHGKTSVSGLLGAMWTNHIVTCIPTDVGIDETRRMLRHSNANLVLTDATHVERAHDVVSLGQRVIQIEHIGGSNAQVPRSTEAIVQLDRTALFDRAAPWRNATPKEPSAIIYTSGSSGTPKAVLHSHQSISASANHHVRAFHHLEGDREIWIAKLNTISGFTDLFRTLLSGGCLIPLNLHRHSLRDLAEAIVEHRPDRIHLVPTIFRRLSHFDDARSIFSPLRLLHLGGEPVTKYDLERFKQVTADRCQLLHNFGCTEVPSARHGLFDHQSEVETETLPLTDGDESRQVGIADSNGTELTPGTDSVSGEIVIHSKVMAKGYWRDSERTRSSFLPSDRERDATVFRTGDQGQQFANGDIVHLGRADRQVKVLGQKVDLASVEATILSHPAVSEAAVVTRASQDSTHLVAHVVPKASSNQLTSNGLIDWMLRTCDKRMVPHEWILHDELPTLANGKIDRKSLTSYQAKPTLKNNSDDQSPTLSRLMPIWTAVLPCYRKGDTDASRTPHASDSFFDCGGDSLTAAELARELNLRFGVAVDVPTIFRLQTMGRLAKLLDGEAAPSHEYEYVDFYEIDERRPTIICVGDHRPLGLITARFANRANTIGARLDGVQTARFRGLSISQLAQAIADDLVAAKLPTPEVVIGFSYGGLVAIALACLLESRRPDRLSALLIEPSVPEDLRPLGVVSRIKKQFQSPKKTRLDSDPPTPFKECRPVINRNIENFQPNSFAGKIDLFAGPKYLARSMSYWQASFPAVSCHELATQNDHLSAIRPPIAEPWLDRLGTLLDN